MGPSCIVLFCHNKGKGAVPGITYFRLTPSRFDAWAAVLRRDPAEKLSKDNRICSEHFHPEDLVLINDKKKLIPGAIPKLKMGKRDRTECSTNRTVPFEFIDVKTTCGDVAVNIESALSMISTEHVIKTELDESPIFSYNDDRRLDDSHRDSSSSCDSEGFRGTPKRIRRDVKAFHNYCICPKKVSKKLVASTQRNQQLQERYKVSMKKVNRLKRKVKDLKLVVQELRKRKIVESINENGQKDNADTTETKLNNGNTLIVK